jgi:hypothetical protein
MSGKNKPVKAYKKKNSPVIGGVLPNYLET